MGFRGTISRFFPLGVTLCVFLTAGSCALTATRPVQEMSDTSAAIRAAKEVQADTLAPELYRQANEWFFKARKDYKLKNFSFAKEYAIRARKYAEQAEFEAVKNGGNRSDVPEDQPNFQAPPPQPTPTAEASPYAYPAPEGTPADVYDERHAEEEAQQKAAERQAQAQAQSTPTSQPTAVLSPPPIVINNQAPGLVTTPH